MGTIKAGFDLGALVFGNLIYEAAFRFGQMKLMKPQAGLSTRNRNRASDLAFARYDRRESRSISGDGGSLPH